MNYEEIKEYARTLGYEFSDEDCAEIIRTSYAEETISEAVHDFLDAYEVQDRSENESDVTLLGNLGNAWRRS